MQKFSRDVSREGIRSNDYNLNIPRYVDSSESAEHWDIYASMFGGIPKAELDELNEFWMAFPELKKALFTDSDIPYVTIAVDDIKSAIKENSDVVAFENAFKSAFASFTSFLKTFLVDQMEQVEISKEESILSDDVFARLEAIPLVDKYAAFQLLDDDWTQIATDLEVIQTEGRAAITKVDPNIVIKKKDGKDQEVQEGWIGHIIPFDLVQSTLLKAESDELKQMENELAEIPSEYESLLEALTEDQKESCKEIVTEEGDAFVTKEVSKKIKELKKDHSEESVQLRKILEAVENVTKKEKELKSQIKSKSAALQEKTKATIEKLSDEEVVYLLEEKWITPLVSSLHKLPDTIVDGLVSKLVALQSKYASTFLEIEDEISETEKLLAQMMDDLEGSEYDMKGIGEFRALLMGEKDE